MSNVFDRLITRITDNYNRGKESNITKMMRLAAMHIQENEDLLQRIGDWRDIDQAEGVTLDYIGRNVGQDRNGLDDSVFRTFIKARIIRNNSNGSIPTIIRFLAFILGVDKQYIVIRERWRDDIDAVGLYIEVDYDFVDAVGVGIEDFAIIVNDLLGAGIEAEIWFRGSFFFSDFDDQVQEDEEHGFSDVIDPSDYAEGNFVMSSVSRSDQPKEDIAVDDTNYYKGDLFLGDIPIEISTSVGLVPATIEADAEGFAGGNEIYKKGGRFGGYYKMFGFPDGETIKPW